MNTVQHLESGIVDIASQPSFFRAVGLATEALGWPVVPEALAKFAAMDGPPELSGVVNALKVFGYEAQVHTMTAETLAVAALPAIVVTLQGHSLVVYAREQDGATRAYAVSKVGEEGDAVHAVLPESRVGALMGAALVEVSRPPVRRVVEPESGKAAWAATGSVTTLRPSVGLEGPDASPPAVLATAAAPNASTAPALGAAAALDSMEPTLSPTPPVSAPVYSEPATVAPPPAPVAELAPAAAPTSAPAPLPATEPDTPAPVRSTPPAMQELPVTPAAAASIDAARPVPAEVSGTAGIQLSPPPPRAPPAPVAAPVAPAVSAEATKPVVAAVQPSPPPPAAPQAPPPTRPVTAPVATIKPVLAVPAPPVSPAPSTKVPPSRGVGPAKPGHGRTEPATRTAVPRPVQGAPSAPKGEARYLDTVHASAAEAATGETDKLCLSLALVTGLLGHPMPAAVFAEGANRRADGRVDIRDVLKNLHAHNFYARLFNCPLEAIPADAFPMVLFRKNGDATVALARLSVPGKETSYQMWLPELGSATMVTEGTLNLGLDAACLFLKAPMSKAEFELARLKVMYADLALENRALRDAREPKA